MSDETTEIETRLFGRAYATLEAEMRHDRRLARALDLIESGMRDGLAVGAPTLARAAGLSTTLFYALFRQRTGFQPHQFLIRRRVLEAARLIKSTDGNLTQISLEAGFTNITVMDRNFRQLLQMAPSELRK
jgi:AraC family transcriptional regulator